LPFRGVFLSVSHAIDSRPTWNDRVSNLFSLGDRIIGRSLRDLFAGSGAFGLEALIRVAANATFGSSIVMMRSPAII